MAENLGISWLYRDILLHLAGQFPCFTQSQRNQVKTCLNPRSFALVWKLSLRTHRLIVEFRAQARDCYVKLMRTAIAWNERDLHGNHPSISLLHTRLLSPIHEYVPGPRLVTDLGFVKGLLDSLVEIRGLHLPSLYSQAVREDLDKCINLGTCLYSGTQFLCQPREAVPYPSNTLLPGDRFPWEQNEIDLLDPTPRSREGV
ncbi:hypothetical protein P175DRAFT_0498701 [Aspergillus ochraceoroseus IBT 24754]|uniref:Uncharacterized protein n=1 Tax=Aspergillus ochraceoroseus IBT 24754 TaxID=1392256 RepID=A0A2T5MAQ7_9EURO|nr:uncharacterized protein P175DRAFT_0498701 [Aspergillus ochraceoroseus IBT 24754]PTU25601.1 hypothetical protein P175DRAFT_0498701 [Aspergillus ochraceoroseus IBT 24754]